MDKAINEIQNNQNSINAAAKNMAYLQPRYMTKLKKGTTLK